MPDTTVAPPSPQTAEAINRPQTGAATPATGTAPVSQASLTQQVNRAQAAKAPIPPGMGKGKSTLSLESIWMRAMIYGETNARKTTTAAKFGSVEDVRIILTRGEDQLIPLMGKDYKYEHCDTAQKLAYALMYPENLWPDWAARPNRILVIDDVTKAKDILLEKHEFNDKGNKQNNMLVHRGALTDLSDYMKSLFAKPMHIIAVAFAKVYENDITHEENVSPDIPPAMMKMLTADFTFCFYIDKVKWMFRTNDYRETYRDTDEKMIEKTFTRVILAKHKVPEHLAGKGVINDLEPMDMAKIWAKIRGAK